MAASPYAEQRDQEIKALTPGEITALLEGHGGGMAKTAELNQYPGPRHVLDLADQLSLSAEQVSRTRAVFSRMKQRASELGRRLVEEERDLELQFVSKSIEPEQLRARVLAIGQLRAEIRLVHLGAHLEQKNILTAEQIAMYDKLRGYAADGHHHAGH